MQSSAYWLCRSYCGYLLLPLLPILLLVFLRRRRSREAPPPHLPPGPWRLPVIGSLHHLVTTKLPMHRAMADLARRYAAPVMYLQLGEVPAVVVSSRDAAHEVLRTHDAVFATRPMTLTIRATAHEGLGIAFAPYGDRWRHLRKICNVELFSAERVRSLRAVREDEAARLVSAIAAAAAAAASSPGEQVVNVTVRITAFVADTALRVIVGERFKRRDEFLKLLDVGLNKIKPGMSVGDMFPSSRLVRDISGAVRKARAFHRGIMELVDCAIEQHRERKEVAIAGDDGDGDKEDLMDVLLKMHKEGGLDIGTVKAVILDLFGAGSETTATTLLWAMSELMRNPTVMEEAQAEVRHALQGKERVTEDDLANLKFLKLVIMETLRLHAATPLLMPRECMEPCKILGYDVPQGALVLVNAWSIGRDPKYWDEPEEFRPDRFKAARTDFKGTDFRYIPFGAGRRICPAIAFAEANMELALAALLYHFDWQLPSGMAPSELDMVEYMGITARRKRDLCLNPTFA
ncbi:hypothetical protein U9M48_026855 [Paspalum notatum var. saurae]|uniref:Cytochrome P450 n=1 Tax=Paspalum notatum var. saurae TaxID=547442 RepID=A0AAQ3TTK4_PASNO